MVHLDQHPASSRRRLVILLHRTIEDSVEVILQAIIVVRPSPSVPGAGAAGVVDTIVPFILLLA